jgi:hypothetical protein
MQHLGADRLPTLYQGHELVTYQFHVALNPTLQTHCLIPHLGRNLILASARNENGGGLIADVEEVEEDPVRGGEYRLDLGAVGLKAILLPDLFNAFEELVPLALVKGVKKTHEIVRRRPLALQPNHNGSWASPYGLFLLGRHVDFCTGAVSVQERVGGVLKVVLLNLLLQTLVHFLAET